MQNIGHESTVELSEVHDFAVRLAKNAGQILLDSLADRRTAAASTTATLSSNEPTREKLNAVDLVTQTDLDVESFIHRSVLETYPTHTFIGEESYSAGKAKEYLVSDSPTWIVDPLDGTVNFTHGLPFFCVSIAFCIDGWPVVGAIFAPLLGQLFSAYRGGGAWLNGSALPILGKAVGPIPSNVPQKCIFGCEWGKDRRDPSASGTLGKKVKSFTNMAADRTNHLGGMVHGIRSLGSATLDLCYVAMGGIDIWWEAGCWEWDVAAGICVLEEAGGLITTSNPPISWETCEIERCGLGGRLYLAIRPAVDDLETGEAARQGQERAVREVWRRVEAIDYTRPVRATGCFSPSG